MAALATRTRTRGQAREQAARAARAEGRGAGRVLAALCLAAFLGTLNGNALGPFLPVMARDLGTTVPLLGQAVTPMLVLGAALGLVIGPLADQYGHRRALLVGLVAVVVCAAGTALAPTYRALLAVRLVGALSGAILGGVSLAIAGTHFPGEARRRAMSALLAAMAMTPIAGFPALTTLGELLGWRAAFLVLAGVALAATGAVACALPPDAAGARGAVRLRAVLAAYGPLLRHRPALLLLGATGLRAVCWLGILTYIGAFFAERHGLTTQRIGLVYMAGGAAYFLGSLAAGRGDGLLGRFALRPLVAATTAAMALLFGLVVGAAPNAPAAVALLGGATFLYAIGWVGLTTLLGGETPAGQATTMVLTTSVFSLGSAAGGALGGLLLAVGGYGALALGLPLCAFGSVFLLWQPLRRAEGRGLKAEGGGRRA